MDHLTAGSRPCGDLGCLSSFLYTPSHPQGTSLPPPPVLLLDLPGQQIHQGIDPLLQLLVLLLKAVQPDQHFIGFLHHLVMLFVDLVGYIQVFSAAAYCLMFCLQYRFRDLRHVLTPNLVDHLRIIRPIQTTHPCGDISLLGCKLFCFPLLFLCPFAISKTKHG